jgi:hypothetical protein
MSTKPLRFRRIAGVEVRRGIIRRKQHQRIQEGLERNLSTASERRIFVCSATPDP